jgi:uncharacterized membrane protein YkvA (DUF1232 family)
MFNPRTVWRFMKDSSTAKGPKIALVVALLYVALPVDAVPDLMPIIGWLDDLGAVGIALAWLERTLRAQELKTQSPPPP